MNTSDCNDGRMQNRRRRRVAANADAITRDPRWAAVIARDAQADGSFHYAVGTTGVYCRPSCGARTPRPENVAFYLSRAEAEHAGFRACKRCRPDRPARHASDATVGATPA